MRSKGGEKEEAQACERQGGGGEVTKRIRIEGVREGRRRGGACEAAGAGDDAGSSWRGGTCVSVPVGSKREDCERERTRESETENERARKAAAASGSARGIVHVSVCSVPRL